MAVVGVFLTGCGGSGTEEGGGGANGATSVATEDGQPISASSDEPTSSNADFPHLTARTFSGTCPFDAAEVTEVFGLPMAAVDDPVPNGCSFGETDVPGSFLVGWEPITQASAFADERAFHEAGTSEQDNVDFIDHPEWGDDAFMKVTDFRNGENGNVQVEVWRYSGGNSVYFKATWFDTPIEGLPESAMARASALADALKL